MKKWINTLLYPCSTTLDENHTRTNRWKTKCIVTELQVARDQKVNEERAVPFPTNLASRILGQAIRELPALWKATFGYEPLLAETFSDVEAREGTCYKASGWLPLGLTEG